MAVSYFPNLILSKRHKISTNMLLLVRFGTLLVGPVTLFFSHHFISSINVKVLVSCTCTGKNNFVVSDDVSLHGLTKRSDRL